MNIILQMLISLLALLGAIAGFLYIVEWLLEKENKEDRGGEDDS